jgi:DNA topoisomerase-6 subunit A
MATKLNTRDAKTMKRLCELADGVVELAGKKRDPFVDVPTRSLSNVKYNKTRRFIEMGRNTNRRHLFNLSQAKSYMQTMLVASGATQLIEQDKTTSIRGLYYLLKHTIEGTKEETFSDQGECDPVIEDCEVLLNSLREELHLYAQKKGDMVGDIVLVDRDDEIDCARMVSGGYGNGEIKIVRRWWHGPQIGSVAPADAILDRSEATITPTALHLGASEQDPLPGVSRAGLADWQRAD